MFSAVNYFDKSGIFIGAVYSVPLLIITFIILVRFLEFLDNVRRVEWKEGVN